MKAIVVFLGMELVDHPAWWGRFLKPGFIHCFVLVESVGQWIKIEGQNGRMCVTHVGPIDADHYRKQGATVVETTAEKTASLFTERTCVGLCKAVLGVRSLALTPWQLYQHLTRCV